MKARYPFLYLVLASAAAAAVLLAVNAARRTPVISGPVLSRQRVALIDISGVLTSSLDVSSGTTSSRSIIDKLEKYGDDDSVKAVVLRIDSPGGTVVSAQEIRAALLRLKDEKQKVVVASMADVSASGGYYVATVADHIYANPGTITGSIGVIMEFPNFEDLLGKIGIGTTTVKSGRYKDTGSAFREMSDEERALLEDLLKDVHAQFIEAVRVGRGMTEEQVVALADGRIFTGRQAQELGLVDETGDLKQAIRKAGELAGIDGEPEVVREKRKTRFWQLLESRLLSMVPFSPAGRFGGKARLLYLWK